MAAMSDRLTISKRAGGTVRSALLRFMVAGLTAVVIIGIGTFFVVRHNATQQAVDTAKTITEIDARGIIAPVLSNGLITAKPAALAALDAVVTKRVIDARVTRVKVWGRDGTIIYSDEHRLIGKKFQLGEDARAAFASHQPEADLTDLSSPENQYEPRGSELLEVYLAVQTPDGTPLLVETYQPGAAIAADEQRIWASFMPALLGSLALIFAIQMPLAWGLARRIECARAEREGLLQRAIDAGQAERRRIASDLHDGVIQSLSGTTLSLAAAVSKVSSGGSIAEVGEVIERAETELNRSVRDLRTLIIDIAPRNLDQADLSDILRDLSESLSDRGVVVDVNVPTDPRLDHDRVTLLYRVAQEVLRNITAHAAAQHVTLTVHVDATAIALEITDDGRGFTAAEVELRAEAGHIGLELLAGLARDAGAELTYTSTAGVGTTTILRMPRPQL